MQVLDNLCNGITNDDNDNETKPRKNAWQFPIEQSVERI